MKKIKWNKAFSRLFVVLGISVCIQLWNFIPTLANELCMDHDLCIDLEHSLEETCDRRGFIVVKCKNCNYEEIEYKYGDHDFMTLEDGSEICSKCGYVSREGTVIESKHFNSTGTNLSVDIGGSSNNREFLVGDTECIEFNNVNNRWIEYEITNNGYVVQQGKSTTDALLDKVVYTPSSADKGVYRLEIDEYSYTTKNVKVYEEGKGFVYKKNYIKGDYIDTYTVTINIHKHSFELDKTTNSTCCKRGYELYKCVCGEYYYRYKILKEHNYAFGSQISSKVIDGTQYVVDEYVCKVCGFSKRQSECKTEFFYEDEKGISYYCNGLKATGWRKISDKWYYFDSSGTMQTGWQKISSKWYYFNFNGVMQTGWQKISGKWYYLNSGGVMQKGWQKISNKWYCFNSDGAMQTGWQKISNKWYYFNSDGAMQTGWQKISNKWYYFNSDGAMQTDWQKISNKWYYFNANGTMVIGWKQIGNKWYYFKDGVMVTGTKTIDGKAYKFDSNGVWIK